VLKIPDLFGPLDAGIHGQVLAGHHRHALAPLPRLQRPGRRTVGRAVGHPRGPGRHHITAIYDQAHRYELYLLIAVGVLIVALIIRHLLRRRNIHPRPTPRPGS
jgi:hypothetical protein